MEYWNPFLETLSRKELDEIEWKNFKKLLAYACLNSALYKEKFRGIDLEDIKTRADLRSLPLTDKKTLGRLNMEKSPPFLEMS